MGRMLANIAHLLFVAVVLGTLLGVVVGMAHLVARWMT